MNDWKMTDKVLRQEIERLENDGQRLREDQRRNFFSIIILSSRQNYRRQHE